MSFRFIGLVYLFVMKRNGKTDFNPFSVAASTAPNTSEQSAGLSPEFKPAQNCSGSFTSCEECGLLLPCEISDSDVETLLDFFLTLVRWDREAREETASISSWGRF